MSEYKYKIKKVFVQSKRDAEYRGYLIYGHPKYEFIRIIRFSVYLTGESGNIWYLDFLKNGFQMVRFLIYLSASLEIHWDLITGLVWYWNGRPIAKWSGIWIVEQNYHANCCPWIFSIPTYRKKIAGLGSFVFFSLLAPVSLFWIFFMIWLISGMGLWNWATVLRDRLDSTSWNWGSQNWSNGKHCILFMPG